MVSLCPYLHKFNKYFVYSIVNTLENAFILIFWIIIYISINKSSLEVLFSITVFEFLSKLLESDPDQDLIECHVVVHFRVAWIHLNYSLVLQIDIQLIKMEPLCELEDKRLEDVVRPAIINIILAFLFQVESSSEQEVVYQ